MKETHFTQWANAGYDLRGRDSIPPIPDNYEPLPVGELVFGNDYVWIGPMSDGSYTWEKAVNLVPPVFQNTGVAFFVRHRISATWNCQSPRCRGRENDLGRCCYWCGEMPKTLKEQRQ